MTKSNFYFLFTMLAAMMFIFAACTKEGPAGPAGKDGVDGEDGIDGQDGTATCIECHDNSQTLNAKILQWEASTHAQGGNFERNSAECAACHTSQGFLQRMANGTHEADGDVDNPNPQNCYTCHQIHSTYTSDDLALTYPGESELWITGETIDLGKGGLCANCHQPRIPDPLPVPGGGNVDVTSPYWGLHHGPQAGMLSGKGAYEVGDGYSNSAHTTIVTDACVTCHMATAYGVQAGGHTMNMEYDYHGHGVLNTAGCVGCHSDTDALETKVEDTQTDITNLLTQLGTILVTQGVMDTTFHAVPGNMTADQAGGVMNFNFVREDGSLGVHNHAYAKTLLQNSIDALQ